MLIQDIIPPKKEEEKQASHLPKQRQVKRALPVLLVAFLIVQLIAGPLIPFKFSQNPPRVSLQEAKASAVTRYVCAVGCDYTNIQTAIDASSDGDTVFVYNGTYSENESFIYIYKNITLKGEGADVVTLDGLDWSEMAGGTGGILIGIHNNDPFDVDGAVVEGFKLLNTLTGVKIYPLASNCTVRSNIIDGMSGLSGYPYGMLIYSSDNTFSDNVITNATTAYGTIYLWEGADFNTIANNTFINNQLTATTWAGAIVLESANNSIIINNTFINNAGSGIMLYDSHNNTIANNNFLSSERGLWFQQWEGDGESESNKIYLNNFDNTENVALCEDDCIPITNNIWNSTEQMEYTYNGSAYTNYLGNYWNDYTGSDSDGDGIGDTPYDIPSSATDKDNYPLMMEFENYFIPLPPTLVSPANSSSTSNNTPTLSAIYSDALVSPANNSSTSNNTPTLTWSSSDATSGIAKYQLYIDGSLDTDNISSNATSITPTNSLSCGDRTWHIRAYDNADNYTASLTFNLTMNCGSSLPPSASNQPIQPEPTPENPEGGFSILINNDDEYTNSETVTLKLYAGADTVRMAISNTEDFEYVSQVPYETIINFQFPINYQFPMIKL